MLVNGQWFDRPEEAELKGGSHDMSHDTRELFYSCHRDDVPPASVKNKCVVHFVLSHKQLPNRKQYHAFIVQQVYDNVGRKQMVGETSIGDSVCMHGRGLGHLAELTKQHHRQNGRYLGNLAEP